MRIDRLLSITIMLLSRRSVTAQQLAVHFDVTVRTVYRDIEALNAAGIPVVSYQGAGGGYCLMKNYRIDRQVFSLDDMLSIVAAFK
ncbi:MAG: helix-turn-helix transcriptional regulator [Chitinispirillaceae bacterium]